jgi:hypothetical protein
MSANVRNCLSINEVKEMLCAEHAGRVLAGETWWAIVPMKDGSFAETGDAGPFWSLVTAVIELDQPLGFEKVVNHLGRTVSVPHRDPEKLLASIIKPQTRLSLPDKTIIEARCRITGQDANVLFEERTAAYQGELEAENKRIKQVIRSIMLQRPTMDANEEGTLEFGANRLGAFDPETGEYEEYEVNYAEWLVPIDRIIEFGEKQQRFLASNTKVSDLIFGAENALWESEIALLKQIVQQHEHEGASEFNRSIDEGMASSADLAAGAHSGK